MYHPRCVFCRSSNTVKFGLPRWLCKRCSRTFRMRCRKRARRAAVEGYVHDRTRRLLRRCDGVVLLDGKHVRVAGVAFTVFVAGDRELGQPIHFLLWEGGEKDLWYWRLLIDLRHARYEPKGFVSDGLPALKELLSDMQPGLPHQRCTVHVFLAARGKATPGGRMTERGWLFAELLRRLLWSPRSPPPSAAS